MYLHLFTVRCKCTAVAFLKFCTKIHVICTTCESSACTIKVNCSLPHVICSSLPYIPALAEQYNTKTSTVTTTCSSVYS